MPAVARPLMDPKLRDALIIGLVFAFADTVAPSKGFTLGAWGVGLVGILFEGWMSEASRPWTSMFRIATLSLVVTLAAIGYSYGEKNSWFALLAGTLWLAVMVVLEVRRKPGARNRSRP
jgi:hypothetical protein